MVEFSLSQEPDDYSGPLDDARIEEPIIPISDLGTTIVETDPRTGAHILQNIEGSIRKGASKMQLMWSTQSGSAIGGRPKAYGKDVRQAIREMLEVNEVELTGAELPTSSNTNMSGFDMQRGTISEEKRQRDLREVKDAIDFQVDVAGGGGIDIWSQEYARSITDDFEKINKDKKYQFYDYSEDELKYEELVQKYAKGEEIKPEVWEKYKNRIEGVKYLYDDRTGQVIRDIRKSSIIQAPVYMTAEEIDKKYGTNFVGTTNGKREKRLGEAKIKPTDLVDMEGNWIDPKDPEDQIKKVPVWDESKSRFKSQALKWADVVRETNEFNKGISDDEKKLRPEEMAFRMQLDNQILQSRGLSLYYSRGYEQQIKGIQNLREEKERVERRKEELKKIFKDDKEGYEFALRQEVKPLEQEMKARGYDDPVKFLDNQIRDMQQGIHHIHESSASADARADEMEEMKKHVTTPDKLAKQNTVESYAELGLYAMNKAKDPRAKKDVYVGPELGWPTAFGGHPDEFIEIIKKSREEMTTKLMTRGMSQSEAKEKAKKHIRGNFDTSHLAMWYNHFDKKPGESDEKRLKRFNEWYLKQVDKMQEEDVIGAIQVVDSITGQHSHLPPGQGIFPVVDAVKRLKEKGWKGSIVSEGHEEEKFGDGRILTETWKAFGSPIGTGYWGSARAGAGGTWGGVQHSYFGATQPPTYIVGAYVPSNEWSLWSEIPFE